MKNRVNFNMKKMMPLLLTSVLFSTSSFANDEEISDIDACNRIKNMGMSIMNGRQSGASFEKSINHADKLIKITKEKYDKEIMAYDDAYLDKFKSYYNDMVIDAYDVPIGKNLSEKKVKIIEFGYKVFSECLNTKTKY